MTINLLMLKVTLRLTSLLSIITGKQPYFLSVNYIQIIFKALTEVTETDFKSFLKFSGNNIASCTQIDQLSYTYWIRLG